ACPQFCSLSLHGARPIFSNIDIERQPNQVHIIIDTARPGVIIGRKGASVNVLRTKLQDMTQKKVKIDVREITKPELDSFLVAERTEEHTSELQSRENLVC